jgi:MYXO-CTERM domain-containing protein
MTFGYVVGMRSATALLALSFVALSSSLIACAPADEEESDGAQQDVTGGDKTVDSPVVYLFENAQATEGAFPKCVGALLGKKVAVTAKACAKQGMVVGRAADKDGRKTLASITKVNVPTDADADIAVIELDKEIGGTRAVITHAPLREGYSVNSFASADSSGIFGGLFGPDKGGAASIEGRLTSETEKHSTIFPNKGSMICAGDLGAPVCSSTSTRIPVIGTRLYGTCGLAGLVVGPDAATQQATPAPGATGTQTQTPAPPTSGSCSGGAWKVVQLGRYADFIRQHAPDAFKPIDVSIPFVPDIVPEGLWGHKSGGNVAKCKIETPKLDAVAVGTETKLTAKVSFAAMQEKAAAFGRFGIASKATPTQMRWLPAKPIGNARGTAFDASFEGAVSALTAGDYVVGFRASGNGGESWTQCDIDGVENGFNVDRQLELKVTPVGGAPTEPTTPETTPTSPASAPPPPAPASDTGSGDYSDAPGEDYSTDDSSSDDDEETPAVAKKKKKTSDGCSAAPVGTGASTGLPMLGVLLGLAAVARRRRNAS